MHRKGMFRTKIKLGGKYRHVGSYRVDVRTKCVGRIAKLSGVFPHTPNAADLVPQIKLMLHSLDVSREVEKLRQIKNGKVRLLSALMAWKAGRLHFAEASADEKALPLILRYIESNSASVHSVAQWRHYVSKMQKVGLLHDRTTVHDLPAVLRQFKTSYEREGKAVYFNNARILVLSFLKKHLGYDEESQILKEAKRVSGLRVKHRREHFPFQNVHDLFDLCSRIDTAKTEFSEWIFFMVCTGIRPFEFAEARWERDKNTGHLRILGTKTANAVRVVPRILWLKPIPRRIQSLQMRLYGLKNPSVPYRVRDFRRTAAIWWESAGIPRSRYSYYLGHGATDVTGIYERQTPSREMLDEDAARFRGWLESEFKKERKVLPSIWTPTARDFLKSIAQPED